MEITLNEITLNESWVNGTYIVDNHKVIIDTAYSTVSIDGARIEFFAQGDAAADIIKEVHAYWIANDCTVEVAILNTIYNQLF